MMRFRRPFHFFSSTSSLKAAAPFSFCLSVNNNSTAKRTCSTSLEHNKNDKNNNNAQVDLRQSRFDALTNNGQRFTSTPKFSMTDLVNVSPQADPAEVVKQKQETHRLREENLQTLYAQLQEKIKSCMETQSSCLMKIFEVVGDDKTSGGNNKSNNNALVTRLRREIVASASSSLTSQNENNNNVINRNHLEKVFKSSIIPPLSLLGGGKSQQVLSRIVDKVTGGLHIINGEFVMDSDTNTFLSQQLIKMITAESKSQQQVEKDQPSSSSSSILFPLWFSAPFTNSSIHSSEYCFGERFLPNDDEKKSNLEEAKKRRQQNQSAPSSIMVPFNTFVLRYGSTDTTNIVDANKNNTNNKNNNKSNRIYRQDTWNKIGTYYLPVLMHSHDVSLRSLPFQDQTNDNKNVTSSGTSKIQEKFSALLEKLNQFEDEWKMILKSLVVVAEDQNISVSAANNNKKNMEKNSTSSSTTTPSLFNDIEVTPQDTFSSYQKKKKHYIRALLRDTISPEIAQHHTLVKLGGFFSRHAAFSTSKKEVDEIISSSSSSNNNNKREGSSSLSIGAVTLQVIDADKVYLSRIQLPLAMTWLLELSEVSSSSYGASKRNCHDFSDNIQTSVISQEDENLLKRYGPMLHSYCIWEISCNNDNNPKSNNAVNGWKSCSSSLLKPCWSSQLLGDENEEKETASAIDKNHQQQQSLSFFIRRIKTSNLKSQFQNKNENGGNNISVLSSIIECFRRNEKIKMEQQQQQQQQQQEKEQNLGSNHQDKSRPRFYAPFSNKSADFILHHQRQFISSGDDNNKNKFEASPSQSNDQDGSHHPHKNNKQGSFFLARKEKVVYGSSEERLIYKHKTFTATTIHISIGRHLEEAVQKRIRENKDRSDENKVSDWSARVWWPCAAVAKHNRRVKAGSDVVRVMVNRKRNGNGNNGDETVVIAYVNDVDVEEN